MKKFWIILTFVLSVPFPIGFFKTSTSSLTIPTDGLMAQWESTTLTLNDSDPVTNWTDLSINNRTASQGTAANRPLYKTGIFGSAPGILFDNVNDELTFTQPPITNFTVFAALAPTAGATYNCNPLSWSATSGDMTGFQLNDSGSVITPHITIYNAAGTETQNKKMGTNWHVNPSPPPYYNHLIVWTYDGSSTVTVRNDGVDETLSSADSGFTKRDGSIGRAYQYYQGYIAAIIVYNRVLSGSEITQVETYLNSKYSLF